MFSRHGGQTGNWISILIGLDVTFGVHGLFFTEDIESRFVSDWSATVSAFPGYYFTDAVTVSVSAVAVRARASLFTDIREFWCRHLILLFLH
jgi:hypothetical protein